jgi:hypothetical protein
MSDSQSQQPKNSGGDSASDKEKPKSAPAKPPATPIHLRTNTHNDSFDPKDTGKG